jgi:hypothetical protein
MSLFDHETSEEVTEARFTAEQHLDKIYHSIPEWVHRLFPDKSLAEKVQLGFEYQQKQWTESFMREVQDHRKVAQFLIFVMRTHGFDYATEYWKFLTDKDKQELKKDLTSSGNGV